MAIGLDESHALLDHGGGVGLGGTAGGGMGRAQGERQQGGGNEGGDEWAHVWLQSEVLWGLGSRL